MPIQRQAAMVGELKNDVLADDGRLIFLPGETGPLRIYKVPEKGRLYAIGADANEGKG